MKGFMAGCLLVFSCSNTQPMAGSPHKQTLHGADKVVTGVSHKQLLHRADLIVAGSSCATCLIRLEKKLKAEKGIVKVVVSILRPFKAVIIYDETETNWTTINKVLEGEKVSATNLKDVPVADVPLVLEAK
jgi:glyceraldehyde-3-phosphate dehydrogenase/erythrose-4-phosphate dehydrogenase